MITCDKCRREFYSLLKEETKKIDGQEITRTYFECPHCGEQYNVCYDSQSTLALKKQIRKNVEDIKTIRDQKKYYEKQQIIKKKQRRLEREMRILQTKYAENFKHEQMGRKEI